MNEIGGFNGGKSWAGIASLFLLGSGFCAGVKSDDDTISIKDRLCLIDENGEELSGSDYIILASALEENVTYKCIKKWDVLKNGARVKSYDTEEEAKSVFDEIVSEITKDKKVIRLD